jgi:hypothetical protein
VPRPPVCLPACLPACLPQWLSTCVLYRLLSGLSTLTVGARSVLCCRLRDCMNAPVCPSTRQEGLGEAHQEKLESLFKGKLQSTLKCPHCPHTS